MPQTAEKKCMHFFSELVIVYWKNVNINFRIFDVQRKMQINFPFASRSHHIPFYDFGASMRAITSGRKKIWCIFYINCFCACKSQLRKIYYDLLMTSWANEDNSNKCWFFSPYADFFYHQFSQKPTCIHGQLLWNHKFFSILFCHLNCNHSVSARTFSWCIGNRFPFICVSFFAQLISIAIANIMGIWFETHLLTKK